MTTPMKICLLVMAASMIMTGASALPYLGSPIWTEVPISFRAVVGASCMLYLTAGTILGFVVGSGLFRSEKTVSK